VLVQLLVAGFEFGIGRQFAFDKPFAVLLQPEEFILKFQSDHAGFEPEHFPS
jgi:hypothetical protein